MTQNAILGLQIENLRGSITPFKLPFERGKKLTIIYGENGTGKSTISDALDLLGNGVVSSLDNRGIGPTRKYWPSLGKKLGDVKVTLETVAGNCSVTVGQTEIVVSDTSIRPFVAVLRRSQVLRLVEADPAKRYEAITSFVDVSGIEASEATLRQLVKDKNREFNDSAIRFEENVKEISRFWEQAGSPPRNAIEWAEKEIAKDRSQLAIRKRAIDDLCILWDNFIKHPKLLQQRRDSILSAERSLQEAEKDLGNIQAAMAEDFLDILEILRAAQLHFLKHPDPAACPLCESTENVKGLPEKVAQKLQSQGRHSKLEAVKSLVATSQGSVQVARQRLNDTLEAAKIDHLAFVAFLSDSSFPVDLTKPSDPVPSSPDAWQQWINAHLNYREEWKKASEKCLADERFVRTLQTSLDAMRKNEILAKELEALIPRLKSTLELIEGERRTFTDGVLGKISKRVGELYESIHPGEGLNKIVLSLNSAKRASLEISVDIRGKGETFPQAYFSDSHLDTLGLCVFLALAEGNSSEKTILVLDDVLGSVDEPHVERVIETIYDVCQIFRHAIITTHYRPWREKFRWGILKPEQVCHFVELSPWSSEIGILLGGAILPEIERLKKLLVDTNPDIQAITGKAGVILEALLDFITLQYSCAVPRTIGNKYELGSLLSSISGKLLEALKAETVVNGQVTLSTELKPIIEGIRTIFQARNVLGAHFNVAAFDLYPSEGIRFAKLVELLCDALVCPEFGRPAKDTGTYWKNSGDTRRLHPLRKPS